nr:STAS domain-containing protein [Massilia sp. DJPM01]
MLPSVIEGSGAALFQAIDAYAAACDETVLFDCSRLARVDYSAAAALLNRLRPIAAGKKIELRELNHLVAALFKLLGFTEVAKLFPHKY